MFGSSLKLTRILGIPVGLHPSLLIMLGLLLIWFTDDYEEITGSQETAFLLAVAGVFLFYLSILLHELGHAIVARRNDIGIAGIDLWMFGGVAKMSRDTDSPGVEFKVAAAGPAVTVLIAALLTAGGVVGFGTSDFFDAFAFGSYQGESGLLALISWLASINVLLLLFNLIPAFPLDGGRIARAIAWKLTGDRSRGTRIAAALGQGFSVVLIGFGLYLAVEGLIFAGVSCVVIGFFIGDAARHAVTQTDVLAKIAGVRVEDVMEREPIAIPGKLTISQAMDEYFLRYRFPWFCVVDERGRFEGVVELERAQRVPEAKQEVFTVNEIMRAEGDRLRVTSDRLIEELLSSESLRRLGALAAVDLDGRLEGIVTVEQISRALQHSGLR